jgi:peroxiredoxin Q/BCP
MFRILFAVVACFAVAAVAGSQEADEAREGDNEPVVLEVGDEAPEFEGLDDEGEEWKSIDHVGENILVVYFYPADMTGGCTRQACSYRDAMEQFEEDGVEVIGVSGDSVENHQVFKKAHELNFTLLADPEGVIARAFGVKTGRGGAFTVPETGVELVRGITAMRWTFVIDLEGHIAYKDDEVDPSKDAANVAKVVAELRAKE